MTKGLRITPVLLSPAEPGPVSGLYLGRPIPSSFFRSSETAQTAQRALDHPTRFNAPLVVCNEEHRFKHLRALGIEDARIILKPEGRNTAPAVYAIPWLGPHPAILDSRGAETALHAGTLDDPNQSFPRPRSTTTAPLKCYLGCADLAQTR
ncbi:hypothetical protein MES4922_120020 [Mesorhizobium ventifaucium]|uniref:Uncharacterized protein n=1 Tax=Mesorhizobium ventifaucium TaxID=666020 RepID=A0ABM9DF81_9HYPH|nr:hypothetical protein MES4922_120020 [Mesorhizobium ventifaucium]